MVKHDLKALFIPKSKVDETLSATIDGSKYHAEPFKSFAKAGGVTSEIFILVDNHIVNDAEVHRHQDDLWICLEGSVEFVVGGKLVGPWKGKNKDGSENDLEIKAKDIDGGEVYKINSGDILWIPAGIPHLHRTEGTAKMFIVKIPRDTYPLEDIQGWKN